MRRATAPLGTSSRASSRMAAAAPSGKPGQVMGHFLLYLVAIFTHFFDVALLPLHFLLYLRAFMVHFFSFLPHGFGGFGVGAGVVTGSVGGAVSARAWGQTSARAWGAPGWSAPPRRGTGAGGCGRRACCCIARGGCRSGRARWTPRAGACRARPNERSCSACTKYGPPRG